MDVLGFFRLGFAMIVLMASAAKGGETPAAAGQEPAPPPAGLRRPAVLRPGTSSPPKPVLVEVPRPAARPALAPTNPPQPIENRTQPAAPATASPSAPPRSSADARLEELIRGRFAKSKTGRHFTVRVVNGTAILEGRAEKSQHKGIATRMAKTAGATSVDNRIQTAGSSSGERKRSTAPGGTLTDRQLEQEIRARFGRSKSARGFTVKVVNGLAILEGQAEKVHQKGAATRMAKAAGAAAVENRIVVSAAGRAEAAATLRKQNEAN